MEHDLVSVSQADSILAVLEGGPESLPEALRIQVVEPRTHKVKVPYYGGYEHFERISAFEDGTAQIIFRWTTRTELAE